jgi:opacity protein-like surface antigen
MHPRTRSTAPVVLAVLSLLAMGVGSAQAQVQSDTAARRNSSDIEAEVKRSRNGAGLRAGTWSLQGHTAPSGATESTMPLLEGYFAKGLDLHLVLENSVAFWRLSQKATTSGGPLGGSSTQVINAYIIPQFTGIRLYPFTRPTDRIEPYVAGGVGFTLGVEDRKGPDGGIFGATGSSGTTFNMGIGLNGGIGAEWHMSSAFGLAVGARYQYVQFLNGELAGSKVYKGFGFQGGLTYRFQYR